MSDANLVYGVHSVRAVLLKRADRVKQLWLQSGRVDPRIEQLLALAAEHKLRVERRGVHELDQRAGGHAHQGAIAELIVSDVLGEGALDELLDKAASENITPFLLVLDGIQDPHNLGACLRTADAAGVIAVILPRDRAVGLSATVRKVASGAAETVPVIQVVNLARTLKWLKERDVWLVGTDDQADTALHRADLTGPLGVVMGAEGAGMRRLTREHCDLLVSIPMAGIVESLNVSVATGVILFEAVRQRGAQTQS